MKKIEVYNGRGEYKKVDYEDFSTVLDFYVNLDTEMLQDVVDNIQPDIKVTESNHEMLAKNLVLKYWDYAYQFCAFVMKSWLDSISIGEVKYNF